MKNEKIFIKTERLRITNLGFTKPISMVEYFKRNREHFKATDPKYPKNFFTESYWQEKVSRSLMEFDQDTAFLFVLCLKESTENVVGTINFSQIIRGPFQACYLGYGMDSQLTGQGLMTEALKSTIDFVFQEKNIHRIMANYMPNNKSSARVLEKLGFVKEGRAKNYLHINGQWHDHILTSLTNNKWRESGD